MDDQRKWFLEMKSIPGEDAVKIFEMTARDIEYYINLVDKVWQGLTGLIPVLKEILLYLLSSIACYSEILHEMKSQLMQQTSLLSYFKKLLKPLQPLATTTLISQQTSASRQDPCSKKMMIH